METEAQRIWREATGGGKRRHKFNASPTLYNGVRYASRAEAAYAERLDRMLIGRMIRFWLRQTPVMLGDQKCVPDFLVVSNGAPSVYFVDVKGFETAAFRKVKKLWAKYGPAPLHVVKGGRTVEVVEPER